MLLVSVANPAIEFSVSSDQIILGFMRLLTDRKATYYFHFLVGVNLVPHFFNSICFEVCETDIVLNF